MNKVVELLEQHCQWLAVAVGGAFLAWALWAYGLMDPVTVGTSSPGSVDEQVWNEQAKPMDDKLKLGTATPPAQAQDDVKGAWMAIVRGTKGATPINSLAWTGGIPDTKRGKVEDEKDEAAEAITALPTPPAVEMLPGDHQKAGRALVQLPLEPGAVQPPAAQPGAIPAGALDLNYIRGEYRISMEELAASFKNAKIPSDVFTSIVGIKIMRQEILPDGKWSTPVEIKSVAEGITTPIPPFPTANSTQEEINTYRGWTETPDGQLTLLRPQFFQVISGDGPWDLKPEKVVVDPETARKELLERNRQAAEERARQRQNTAPRQPTGPGPRPGPGGPRRGAEDFAPQDAGRPFDFSGMQLAQLRPPTDPRLNPRPMPGEDMDMPNNPQPMQPGQGSPDAGALPLPAFQPAKETLSIVSWFYDRTVVEGKTYRYQVLYSIRNPLYQDSRLKDQKLQNQFAISSTLDEKAWSEPKKVETTTRFYLANNVWTDPTNISSVKFEVFKWSGGKWQSWVFPVNIGEKIGETHAGVDFATGVTLVDVRYDKFDGTGKPYVVLLATDGQVIERDIPTDKNDPERAQLTTEIKQNVQPPAGTPGGNMEGT